MLRNNKIISSFHMQIYRKLSTVPKIKPAKSSELSQNHLKSGYINLIRLEAGKELCIVRPQNMKSLSIKPELLEYLFKNNHSYQNGEKSDSSINGDQPIEDFPSDNAGDDFVIVGCGDFNYFARFG